MLLRILLLAVLVVNFVPCLCSVFKAKKAQHSILEYSKQQITHLAQLSDEKHMKDVLEHILIPRVVGTLTHTKVYNYIIQQLSQEGFKVEIDEFQEETPIFGKLTFKNIIGVLDPNAERFLVLACHYDSKYFPNDVFLGATDSAVPCAMMLNLIHTMKNELQAVKEKDVSLMLLFLDGEEAFKEWTDTDSIYGARNLAKTFDGIKAMKSNERVSMLDRMDVFVLLDLLGPPQPVFYSYFRKTDRHYLVLSRAENVLSYAGLLKNYRHKYFREATRYHGVQDDHLPFMNKGVPILHLIPSPFPSVWHTPKDDGTAIDLDTIENLNKIMRVFVGQYLHAPINK